MQRDNMLPARVSDIHRILSDCRIEGLIFFDMNNIRYLTGFTGSDGILIIDEKYTILLVDGRYTAQARQEAVVSEIVEYKDKIKAIAAAIKKGKLKNIGFEAEAITVSLYNQLTLQLSGEVLVPLCDELRLLRARKDESEIILMKKAAEIASASIQALIADIRPDRSEKDLALQLEIIARRLGADQLAFEAIVASGENSILPHARPTERKIRKGDFIVIDFGVKYKGYCSDETCTFAFGELTDRQKNAYQKVKDAHDAAIAAVRADAVAGDIDSCARNILGPEYAKFFSHGTGHGVGMDVHEAPRLAPESRDILKAQMVVTVEPGVYLPGHWGIRIEDSILVKENSCEKLTKMDKELIIIE
jgi:Xaa-Pro aminopeptidase